MRNAQIDDSIRTSAAGDWVDDRQIGHLIPTLEAQAVCQVENTTDGDADRNRPAPIDISLAREAKAPTVRRPHTRRCCRRIQMLVRPPRHAWTWRFHVAWTNAASTTSDSESKGHETSFTPFPGCPVVSTSPPLGFSPSGAATSIGPRFPQRLDLRRCAVRNPSCHSVDTRS